jgi:glycosyltransferase involved in cell wall biosynthesis
VKKTCLLICYTNLAGDPRVMKHFEALKEKYEVITAGVSPIGKEKKFIRITEYSFWDSFNKLAERNLALKWLLFVPARANNFLRFKAFRNFYFLRYWNIRRMYDFVRLYGKGKADLIISNDLNTLPLAAAIAGKKTKLLYDAHEYHAEEYAEKKFWVFYNKPLVGYLYKRYINRVDACITVGENIAKRYEDDYKKPFAVIYNTPPYLDIKPSEAKAGRVSLVYSGMYGPNRKIDEVIKAMDYLPASYELHLLITNVTDELRRLIADSGASKRIILHKAVALNEVAQFLSRFDIGVHLMASVNFNNNNALPNKYFQYIQARLVTAFGPLSEISTFTGKHHTGIICNGYTGADLANVVQQLSVEEINRIKANNAMNAKLFCEENEIVKLKQVYEQLMA